MMEIRKIKKKVTGRNAVDGAGVKLVRVFGYQDTTDFDPFLMLDAFDSDNPADYVKGFPWHPHRGIETITYLVSGEIEHGDSLGNKGAILSGDCQWMTAGSGIIHQEMPKPAGRMLGVQLWLNLPAAHKMTPPKYRGLTSEEIPVVDEENMKIHVISGAYKDINGATKGEHVDALYLDVEMNANSQWALETDRDHNLFVYILEGEAVFGPDPSDEIQEKHAILFEKGDQFIVETNDHPVRFLLMSGKPLKEPIAWGGPIVMNTREELALASKELDDGTFIK